MKTTFFKPLRTVALLSVLWGVPQLQASAQEFEVDGIWYSVLSEGGVKVIPNPDKSVYSFSEVVLPDTVLYEATGYAVTEIGDTAFYQCADLVSVTIPKSVTNVASMAFYECSGLRYVKIADSGTPLSFTDNYQFWTSPLDSAYIGRDLEYTSGSRNGGNSPFVGRNNLQFTPIKKVEFGDSVTVIGDRLFQYSASLESIVFGDNVTEILSFAFRNCTALTVLEFPASVTTIKGAFNSCDNISRVVCLGETPPTLSGGFPTEAILFVPEGCLDAYQNAKVWSRFAKIIDAYIPDFMVDGIKYSLVGKGEVGVVAINDTTKYVGDLVLPETVEHEGIVYCLTEICEWAFSNNRYLSSIVIPDGVTAIRNYAFRNCHQLQSVRLPDSLTVLGASAFEGCSQLRKVTVPEGVTSIEYSTFERCPIDTMIVKSPTPPNVRGSGDLGTAYRSVGILIVPTGALQAYMAARTWRDFYKIEEEGGYSNVFDVDGVSYRIASLGDSVVTVVGANASEIIIPDSVTYDKKYAVTAIGNGAFEYNENLTSVVISEGVVTLGGGAFKYCSNLRSISIPGTLANGDFTSALYRCTNLESITVAEGHPYLDSRDNCNALIMTEGDEITLLIGCKNTVIPDGVTAIAFGAFYNTAIKEVTIPNSVTKIYPQAFALCTELESVRIGSGADVSFAYDFNAIFNSCEKLHTIEIDEANPLFDSRNNCNAIVNTATNTLVFGCNGTKIPEGVTSIAPVAFYYCPDMKELAIPASVTSIWSSSFSGCSGLTSIVVDEANPVYDSRNNCNAVIKTEGDSLVRGCMNTIIPEDVKFIGAAFCNCLGLEEIVIPDAVRFVGDEAFFGCRNLKTITIGAGVEELGYNLFSVEYYYNDTPQTYLATIVLKGTTPPVFFQQNHGFTEVMRSYIQLVVPEGSLAAYRSADVWKDFAHITEGEGIMEFDADGIRYRVVVGDNKAMVRPRSDEESLGMESSTYPDSIVIPETVWHDGKEYVVNAIGEYAFYNRVWDSGMRYLSIPSTMEEIGYNGLATSFTGTVICYATIPPQCLGHTSFGVSHDAVLRVPKASLELYEQAEWWKYFLMYNAKIEAIEDTMGIEHIETNVPYLQSDAVYDLSGRRLTDVENLKSGIYIVNGKKVVIR